MVLLLKKLAGKRAADNVLASEETLIEAFTRRSWVVRNPSKLVKAMVKP